MQKKLTAICPILPALLLCATVYAQPQMMKDTRPLGPLPQATQVDKERIMSMFEGQQFEDAIGYLGTAVGPDSVNLSALGYLGYAYYMNDDHASAQRCYLRIFHLDSAHTGALRYLELLNAHDDPDAALDYTSRLVALLPDRAVWWRTRGELERRLKQPDSALSDLTHAFQLAPLDAKNVLALSDLLVERKEYLLADSLLDAALVRDSTNFPLIKLRVRAAYNQKDYATVPALGERVVRMNLPDVNVISWLALSYYNLQKYTECAKACDFLLDNGYTIESVYYYKARALTKLHQYKESNDLLDVCLKLAISNTAAWYFNDRGDNFEGMGQGREALHQYDTAYYLFRDPLMLYNSGRIAESVMKQEALAKKYYRQYLAVAKPETDVEKKVYAYVKKRMRR